MDEDDLTERDAPLMHQIVKTADNRFVKTINLDAFDDAKVKFLITHLQQRGDHAHKPRNEADVAQKYFSIN